MKKDARLTIRVPRRLKDRLVSIERVYGVGLPKIANECLTAFCEYVKQKEQTLTFPILINPTHAATEGQLKLFAENLPFSTDVNGQKRRRRPGNATCERIRASGPAARSISAVLIYQRFDALAGSSGDSRGKSSQALTEHVTESLLFVVRRRPLLVLRLSKKRKEIYDNR